MEQLKASWKELNNKSPSDLLLFFIPYILVIAVSVRMVELYRLCDGKIFRMLNNLTYLYKSAPHIALTDLLIGIPAGVIIIYFWRLSREMNRKNTRKGEEYGSARCGA